MPVPRFVLRRLPGLLLLAAAIGIAACVIAILGGRLASGLDPDRARLEVFRGIESGAIPDNDQPEPYGPRGPHPFNECLIYMMAGLQSGAPWRDAAAPLAPTFIASPSAATHPPGNVRVCGPLADWARSGKMGIEVAGYGRYLHGGRLIAALALQFGLVQAMPTLLSIASYSLLVLALARNAAHLAGGDWYDADERTRRLGLCIAAASFLLFYGLPSFSRLLSHAPADLGLFGFVLLASGRNFALRPARTRVVLVACFASWAAIFEFLSGPLPMLAGTVLLVHGLSSLRPARAALGNAALSIVALVVALVTAFAAKQGAFLLLGEGGFYRSMAALLRWTDGTAVPGGMPTLMTLANTIRWKLPELYGGSTILAYGVLLLSAVQILGGAIVLLATRPREPARLSLLVAPLLIVGIWYVALRTHTVIHVNFMVRLTVWFPLIGWLLTVLALFRILDRWQAAGTRIRQARHAPARIETDMAGPVP